MEINSVNPGVAGSKFAEAVNSGAAVKDTFTSTVDKPIKGLKLKEKIGDAFEFSKDKLGKLKEKAPKSLATKVKDGAQKIADKLKTTASTKKGKLALFAVAGGLVGIAAKAIVDKVAGKGDEEANIQTEEYEVAE